jgi:arsenate reductase
MKSAPYFALVVTFASGGPVSAAPPTVLPAVDRYLAAREAETDQIPADRKQALGRVAEFVEKRREAGEPARLLFICTHNSRRSHMAELWARASAARFGVEGVETFSGGTEATAFNPRAVSALERAGFQIEATTTGDNPRYAVRYAKDAEPAIAHSKVYDADSNPTSGFAAIMTCSQADESCPLVRGAASRIAIPYEDPKAFDGTPGEARAYDERSAQIAREMTFIFSRL